MPQRSTNTDRALGVRLLPAGLPAVGDVSVVLQPRRRRWSTDFEDLNLWRSLDGRSRRYNVAVIIEYDPTDRGPENVAVSAVVDGLGVRWRLAPEGTEAFPVEARSVEIHSRDGRPIGRGLLSRIGLARMHDALARALETPAAASVLGERWGATVAPKPGRRGRPDLFYAQVALEYVQVLEIEPAAPVRRMVELAVQRGEHLTPDEVRARLRRARERGLLTAAPAGRAGGRLTAKARELLDEVGLIKEGEDGQH